MHANSAREAVVKLCTLPLLAGENVDRRVRGAHRRRLRSTWSCRSASTATVRRRVREIVALPGRVEGGVVETEDIFASPAASSFARKAIRHTQSGSTSTGSTWPRCSVAETLGGARGCPAGVRLAALRTVQLTTGLRLGATVTPKGLEDS